MQCLSHHQRVAPCHRASSSGRCRTTVVCSAGQQQQQPAAPLSRRDLGLAVAVGCASMAMPAQANVGFKKEMKKRKLTPEDYTPSEGVGLPIFEEEEGRGTPIKPGDRVVVHWDAIYRGLDVQSSRSARLLGGNRTLAVPYEFTVGGEVSTFTKQAGDSAGGLFSGADGPKPPKALSLATVGMKRGGRRSVYVSDPALGYGSKGILELPGDTPFELKVEVLDVFPVAK